MAINVCSSELSKSTGSLARIMKDGPNLLSLPVTFPDSKHRRLQAAKETFTAGLTEKVFQSLAFYVLFLQNNNDQPKVRLLKTYQNVRLISLLTFCER